jgi:hypothetical protein
MDPVAYLAFEQALWFDCSILVRPASARLRAIERDALLEAGLVLHQEITGTAVSLREHEKYTRVFQQALDAFPVVRAAPDGKAFSAAFSSLAVAYGYPADPLIATLLMIRYVAFQKSMPPSLASFQLGGKDYILDRTGQIPFRDWLELAVAEGARGSGGRSGSGSG